MELKLLFPLGRARVLDLPALPHRGLLGAAAHLHRAERVHPTRQPPRWQAPRRYAGHSNQCASKDLPKPQNGDTNATRTKTIRSPKEYPGVGSVRTTSTLCNVHIVLGADDTKPLLLLNYVFGCQRMQRGQPEVC